jgi:predicted nucleic acid-binding Zn ribbon protein
MDTMVQDDVLICPNCSGALRKIYTDSDVVYVCNDSECGTVLRVADSGQSERELKCEVLHDRRI